jgi:hypothetical protein
VLTPRISIAVGAEQDLRLDLAEAIEHAFDAEVREHDDHTMPCEVAASASIAVSGMFGMNATARSPERKPSCCSACTARDTSLDRSE